MTAKSTKSHKIIFEVIQLLYLDSFSLGLYASKKSAQLAAQKLARKLKYKKIDGTSWGESDAYGVTNGIQIKNRTLLT